MFVRCLIFSAFLVAFVVRAETVMSQSQQFVVHAADRRAPVERVPAGSVEVVPEFLVVTAERVKQAVFTEIPALAEARMPIHIGIAESTGADGVIGIHSSRFADGWRYDMAVPRVAEEARLVKAFINVTLLRYANRNSERSAELPAWVTEGLSEQLLYSVGPTLVVGNRPASWEASTRDLQHWTRETLRTNSTPGFQELTSANVPARRSQQEAVYLAGTHLLVHALLEAPRGRQRFAKFLQMLPHTWNWQTAFMQAFEFQRMLDVEKWWSLTVIEFTTRDQRQAWSAQMSLRKLDELLRVRIEYRDATNALPQVRLVDLKTILEEDDPALQRQSVQEVISHLRYTWPHMAPQVAELAYSYQKTLESFLQKRSGAPVRPGLRVTAAAQSESAKADALRQISALDQKSRAMAERMLSSTR